MMNWVLDHPFVLSVSFHDGRVMINYPWDDSPDAVEGEKCVCSDDDVFRHLAALYAENHPYMWTGQDSDLVYQNISKNLNVNPIQNMQKRAVWL